MTSLKYCDVKPTWKVKARGELELDIHQAIVYRMEDSEDDAPPPLDTKGIILTAPESCSDGDQDVSCSLTISCCNPPYNVSLTAVDIVCEAHHVEIYGASGEYVATSKGMELNVEGDHKLFLSQHTFDEPLGQCIIKLLSLENPEEVWLHSLHITLDKAKAPPFPMLPTGPSIDMEKVKSLLAEMDSNIPENAKSLIKSIETFQKNKQAAFGSMGSMLSAFIGGLGKSVPATDTQENVPENTSPDMGKLMSEFSKMKAAEGNVDNLSNSDVCTPVVKQPTGVHTEGIGTQKMVTQPNSTSQTDITDKFHSGESMDINSSQDSSSEVFEHVPSSSMSNLGSTFLLAQLQQVEQRMIQQLAAVEERIVDRVAAKVAESERRVQERLDELINHLANGQDSKTCTSDTPNKKFKSDLN